MVKKALIMVVGIAFLHCVHMPVDHNNPYDRVYENGNYRIVLAVPVKDTETKLKVEWSDVAKIPTAEQESPPDFLLTKAELLVTAAGGTFTESDLNAIRAKNSVSASSSVAQKFSPFTTTTAPYNGSNSIVLNPNQSYEMVLELSGTVDGVGVYLHSNIVRYEP